jgi:lysylphosphatidylglycerol synthetase-like protein (DUF2156 family)
MLLVALVVLVFVAMWIYIFFFADTSNPNRLPDRAWTAQAEAICKSYADRIGALPAAGTFADIKPRSEAMRQRAAVGQEATDLLTQMVADLRASPSNDAVTRDAVSRWLADYDTYLQDRRRHLARWAAGEDPPFTETAVGGKPISLGMDDFAAANHMNSCEVPRDLG